MILLLSPSNGIAITSDDATFAREQLLQATVQQMLYSLSSKASTIMKLEDKPIDAGLHSVAYIHRNSTDTT